MPRRTECSFEVVFKTFPNFLLNLLPVLGPNFVIGLKLADFNDFGYQTRKAEEFGVKCIRGEFVKQFIPRHSTKAADGSADWKNDREAHHMQRKVAHPLRMCHSKCKGLGSGVALAFVFAYRPAAR